METMRCKNCALKHTSAAISYAKEILSGHGKGAQLDHRADFLGQLVNLQHHLQSLDNSLYVEIKNYRQNLQDVQVNLTPSDVDYLRQIYLRIQKSEEELQQIVNGQIDSQPIVLFLYIKNKLYFDLCYKMILKNLTDYIQICYLQSDIDLSEYNIKKVEYNQIDSEYIYIIAQNQILLKTHTAKDLLRISDYKKNFDYKALISELKQPMAQTLFYYDNFPCVVKKQTFQPYVNVYDPLTHYCNQYPLINYRAFNLTVKLNKKICCSNRQRIKTAIYCNVQNQQALQSLKNQMHI